MGSLVNNGQVSRQRDLFAGALGQAQKSSNATHYVRVVEVVLSQDDLTSDEWQALGCNQALYGIFYQELFDPVSAKTRTNNGNFAYCKQGYVKSIPIKNEVVSLDTAFCVDGTQDGGTFRPINRVYWDKILAIWHTPNYNPFPNIKLDGSGAASTGNWFKEAESGTYNVQLHPGDVLLEGRYNQSLRFGATLVSTVKYCVTGASGEPYTILRNGKGSTYMNSIEGSSTTVGEDINKDSSSIYLTADHRVDLTQAYDKRKAWTGSDAPQKASLFKGAQIISNTDRYWINARKDIELTAKEALGLGAAKIGLDATDYVALDATKIYLGTKAFQEAEPVLKGSETTTWLQTLCTNLLELLAAMQTGATTGDSKAFISAVATAAASVQEIIKTISSDSSLSRLKSKKTFTE